MAEQTPQPDEFGRLRVTDKDTGHTRSIVASDLPHGNYTVLEQPASLPNGDAVPTVYGSPEVVKGYTDRKVDELRAEIKTRNEGRPEESKIPASGNKDDLVAALAADDANTTEENS